MNRNYLLLVVLFICAAFTLQAQTTVSGTVTDAETSEGLIGASVIIKGTTTGTTTDNNGKFSLTTDKTLPLTLEVSYTGFTSQDIKVENANADISVKLTSGLTIGDEVVISASRRAEKVQDAPASITVINARKLAASPNENPIRNLVNAPGVTIQQQSAARINVQLRGDGGIFGSASFPILDYRSLSGPGLGTFDALNSPLNNIDIETIEVVRGPGSALYGPGVTAGVVHFISKSPIDKPGTTVQLIGGELSTLGVSARHATKISDKFGFKINAVYKQGNEFVLDPNDPTDAARIALLQDSVYLPAIVNDVVDATQRGELLLNASQVDTDGDGNPMQSTWNQTVLTGALEFRPQDDFSVNVAGGFNTASAVFYNSQGEGLSQASEIWAQARMQKGGLFAQAFVLSNNGGTNERPSFLYQTGNVTSIIRQQIEAQVQYNFDLPNFLNSNWTTGIDYRLSLNDTRHLVYGRNEDDDNYGIAGAYVQGKFALVDKLDLVLAARGDQFSFTDEFAFTPRAVVVYKAAPSHTFRFGFNRAVSAPTQLQVNIDFPVSTPVPGAFDIWLLGNAEAQTFDNAVIKLNGALGGVELPMGTPGLPNAVTYGAVNSAVLAQLIPGIEAQTGSAALAQAIQTYLMDPANTPGGTTGQFYGINLFNGQPLGVTNAPAAQLRTEDTWEFGYKGLIDQKLAVSLDVYNRKIDGATLFTAISPSYTLLGSENIGSDLGTAVATQDLEDYIFNILEAGNPGSPANLPTAQGLVAAIAGAYTGGGDAFATNIAPLIAGGILAATPTDQMPQDGITHVAAGYRTFEAYSYTGVDFGAEYYFSKDFSIFANYSFISKNEFNPVIKGTDGVTELTSISAPKNKYRLGANYVTDEGWRANLAFQHDDSYTAFVGQYSGDTDPKNTVDLGVGYKFDFGLTLDFSAQNLFNNKYRAFPGMPEIGRRALLTLTYDFGNNKEE